jgi:hypothetical protein
MDMAAKKNPGYFVVLTEACASMHPLDTMIQTNESPRYYWLNCSKVDLDHQVFAVLHFQYQGKAIHVSLPYHLIEAMYLLEEPREKGPSKKGSRPRRRR